MSEEKFNPQDIEEILSRQPSSDCHKVRKGDIPEIAKSIGIGIIEILKSIPAIACLWLSATPSPTKEAADEDDDFSRSEGYRHGPHGFGYYDANNQKID